MIGGHQGAHVRIGIRSRTGPQLGDALLHPGHQLVGGVTDGDHNRDRHAPLPRRSVTGGHGGVGGQLHIGVGEDHHVVLGTTECLDPLAIPCPRLVDVTGDRCGADKAHRRDVGVLQDGVHRHLVPMDDIEDAIGETGLGQPLRRQLGDGGVLLGRFEDEGVPTGDRHRVHPHRDHRREVERGDPGHDAEGLANGESVDTGGHLVGVLALLEVGDIGDELDHLDSPLHLTEGVGKCLAVLRRQGAGHILTTLVEDLSVLQEDLLATGHRGVTPVLERLPCRSDRPVDIGHRRHGNVPRLLTGSGVEHRCGPPRCRSCVGSADPVLNRLHVNLLAFLRSDSR